MEISEDLRCVFSAEVAEQDGSYVIEIPEHEIELGTIREDEVYRVAMLARNRVDGTERADGSSDSDGAGGRSATGSASGDREDRGNGSLDRDGSRDATAGGGSTGEPEPPVDRGDQVTVDIEGIGDQGDGIARVDRGYVIIVPDTEKGERVRIRVTSVKQNVAFAEVVDRVERHQYE